MRKERGKGRTTGRKTGRQGERKGREVNAIFIAAGAVGTSSNCDWNSKAEGSISFDFCKISYHAIYM
jgi:hypothetical protein